MKVKICGITNYTDALACCISGAQYLGFNFYHKSKRYIQPHQAREIINVLPRHIKTVGIFVNHSLAEVKEICLITGIDILQFHGDEGLGFVKNFSKPCIKRISQEEFSSFRIDDFKSLYAVLIDAIDPEYGGTGKIADLDFAKACAQHLKLFLAGGVNEENVKSITLKVKPYAVDVCSGLEKSAGKKSKNKIAKFFANIS